MAGKIRRKGAGRTLRRKVRLLLYIVYNSSFLFAKAIKGSDKCLVISNNFLNPPAPFFEKKRCPPPLKRRVREDLLMFGD